jgi:hypothetical protein
VIPEHVIDESGDSGEEQQTVFLPESQPFFPEQYMMKKRSHATNTNKRSRYYGSDDDDAGADSAPKLIRTESYVAASQSQDF